MADTQWQVPYNNQLINGGIPWGTLWLNHLEMTIPGITLGKYPCRPTPHPLYLLTGFIVLLSHKLCKYPLGLLHSRFSLTKTTQ